MRRTNRISAALFLAALLLTGLAPAASAEPPLSPAGWFGSFSQTVTGWWAALTGDAGSQRSLSAASEVTLGTDPDGQEVSPPLDPNDAQVSTTDTDDSEVSPSIDPNG